MEQSLRHYFHDRECRLLLHCCCAPCSCSIIERLLNAGINVELFFYNPNIHPEGEYTLRKNEIVRYAQKKGVTVVDADYDPEKWLSWVRGHEKDPERGVRCRLCFEWRLLTTAAIASKMGFPSISTTLGISRRKRFDQVTEAGRWAVSQFPEISFVDCNWRKNGGAQRMDEIIEEEKFYKQKYCGCLFSSSHCTQKD